MMSFHQIFTDEGVSIVTWIGYDTVARTVSEQEPEYVEVVNDLTDDRDPSDWFDDQRKNPLGDERLTVVDNEVVFDGDVIPETISQVILRYKLQGRATDNLVRFMERLLKNPSERSREMLFTWTQSREMVIDIDGFIIGYKGVSKDMLSIHSGTAAVDGVEMTGHIPNLVGTIITMDRDMVNADPNQGCSYGLHVGNWSYASSFGSVLLEVRIDPADVVSVPRDCSFQKLRCCRYEVVAIHESGEDDISDVYEPEATISDSDLDGFSKAVPESFLSALRTRVKARFSRSNKDDQEG